MAVVVTGASEARNQAINMLKDDILQKYVDRINERAANGYFDCVFTESGANTSTLICVGEALRDYGYEYSIYEFDGSARITISWIKAPYDK